MFIVGIFFMFMCINSLKVLWIIIEMLKFSYGMYLMYIFWLGLWVIVFKYILVLFIVVVILCIVISIFICCFIILKFILFILGSKWIIGWIFEYGYFYKIGYVLYVIVLCRWFIFRYV